MAMISDEAIAKLMGSKSFPSTQVNQSARYGMARAITGSWSGIEQTPIFTSVMTADEAKEVNASLRQALLNRGDIGGKAARPWDIDPDLYDNLDPSEVWWGFEFETGYITQEAQQEVLGHVWDTWDGVAFDAEGEGAWATEITFHPQELSKYREGTAKATQFMEYLTGEGRQHTNRTDYFAVGTHINISLPDVSYETVELISWSLNMTGKKLPINTPEGKNTCEELFGRSRMYGWFYARNAGRPYIEGKLFRTTYDSAQFAKYVKVCEGITRIAQALAAMPVIGKRYEFIKYCDNLYDVCINGSEPSFSEAPMGSYVGSYENTYEEDYDDDGCMCDDCVADRRVSGEF